MTDEFLNEVDNVVSGIPVPVEPVAAPTTETTPVDLPKTEQPAVVDALSQMFDDADPLQSDVKEEAAPTVKDVEPVVPEQKEKVEKKESPYQRRQPRQKKRQEKLLDTFLGEDEEGNLINTDGEVIALAGKSRTYYESLKSEGRKQRKAAGDLALQNLQLAEQFKSLYDEYKDIKDTVAPSPVQSIVKETGFSEPEAGEAMKLLKLYKTDPIAAIKSMLTQAQMGGIDISQIGATITPDPATLTDTVRRLLDEQKDTEVKDAPSSNPQEEALQEANDFLHNFPEAEKYAPAIADAKNKFPQMSLPEIWLRLKNSLDNRKPKPRQTLTMRRKKQAKPAKRVTVPNRNYGDMSFEEIAASIVKDST